jgi:hypothetical protein
MEPALGASGFNVAYRGSNCTRITVYTASRQARDRQDKGIVCKYCWRNDSAPEHRCEVRRTIVLHTFDVKSH